MPIGRGPGHIPYSQVVCLWHGKKVLKTANESSARVVPVRPDGRDA